LADALSKSPRARGTPRVRRTHGPRHLATPKQNGAPAKDRRSFVLKPQVRRTFDVPRATKHGRALESLLDDKEVTLVEDAVYVRQIAAEASLAEGDRDRARIRLAEARALVDAYASQIIDRLERDRFLQKVRENARVIELEREIA